MAVGLNTEHRKRSGTLPESSGSDGTPQAPAPGEVGDGARKRVAVELIRNHDPALKATARRYSICADDADDAYQRGIEILLAKAPTDNARRLLPWARTVIKHEALAVRRSRERILGRPGPPERGDEYEDWVQLIPSPGDGTDEQVAAREKVARSREALGTLKPAELKALTLLAQGFSYAEIAARCNWTRTKVNRCLAEGRQRFRSVFSESEAGERCSEFEPLLSATCDGEIDPDRRAEIEDHLNACGHCRATLRAYRAAPRAAAALVPVVPSGLSLWDRAQELAVYAQVRFQSLGQGPDSSIGAAAASGGTRGAGAAVLAKALAICAGTAGGAAVCVATGVLPAPELTDQREPDRVVKEADRQPAPAAADTIDPIRLPERQPPETPVNVTPEPAPAKPDPARSPDPAPEPAPTPTPTEVEFTPEATGTPVPAAAPPPPPPASAQTSGSGGGGVPVGGGGGEFGP